MRQFKGQTTFLIDLVQDVDGGEIARPRIRNFNDGHARPTFSMFNYVEKAEYWAFLWGTLIPWT